MKTGAAISKNIFGEGTIPRITATSLNNGIGLFTDNCQHKNFREAQNVISYSFLGDVFYHPYGLSLDMKIHFFSLKSRSLNQYIGLFLVQCLKNSIIDPSYGNQISIADLKKKKIILPINIGGSPNWDYMEQYIVNIMKTIEVPKLEPIKSSSKDLKSIKWHEFKINDIMHILRGIRLTASDMGYGNIPFIGASDSNNGITNWTSDTNSSTDKNVLGVNYNGSVGEVFYHPYLATFSDDVKRLKLRYSARASKEVYLFIKTMLLQQKNKYAYGYKFNGTRMKAQKIILPVTDEGAPDWQFMEDYIKSISNSHLL